MAKPPDAHDSAPGDNGDLQALFSRWIADQDHARIAQFFRNNPGVIESMGGLAVRLGTTVQAIEEAVRNHVALGLLVERTVGNQKILRYSQTAHKELEQRIVTELGGRA